MHTLKLAVGCCLLLATTQPAAAQLKILKKVANTANSVLNGASNSGNNNTPPPATEPGTMPGAGSRSGGKPTNRGGAGLIATPPDVPGNLATSETAFKNKNYGEARYALQQAMLGVELQIGQAILKSLPEEVSGLPKEAANDQVASTGWGWAGLTIIREYQKDDKAFTVTIANNAMWMQAVNMFLTSGMYNQSSGGQQNWKQTRLKGNKAVVEYNDGSGYKLTVPLGQTTMLLLEGVNFANEQDFMKAAETIDVDKIKDLLNEK